jgi:hypothetical protein
MSQQAGKTVSKWTAKDGEQIFGGQLPISDDIETAQTISNGSRIHYSKVTQKNAGIPK